MKTNLLTSLIWLIAILGASSVHSQDTLYFDSFNGTTGMQLQSEYQADIYLSNQQLIMTGGSDFLWTGNGDSTTYEQAFTDNFYHRATASKIIDATNYHQLELHLRLKQTANLSTNYSWLRVLANGYPLTNPSGRIAANPISLNNDEFYYLSFNLDSFAGGNLVISLQSSCKIEDDDQVIVDEIVLSGTSLDQHYFSPYLWEVQGSEWATGWKTAHTITSSPFIAGIIPSPGSTAWYSFNVANDNLLPNNHLISPNFNLELQENTLLVIEHLGDQPAYLLAAPNGNELLLDTLHSFAGSTAWETDTIDLSAYDGLASVRFAIHCRDTSDQLSLFALRKWEVSSINSSTRDLACLSWENPANQNFYSAYEPASIWIKNLGLSTIDSAEIGFRVNHAYSYLETISTSLAPGDSLLHLFNQTIDLHEPGTYTLEAWVNTPYDVDTSNNSVQSIIQVTQPTISSYPYIQSFEGTQYWTTAGNSSSWECGIPNGSTINYAPDGIKAWVTNLDGTYNTHEKSQLISPVFDFSYLQNPQVSFKLFYTTEIFEDGLNFQYSLDEGQTWTTIGSQGDAELWYNASFVAGLGNSGSLHGWSGNLYNTYLNIKRDLPFLAEEQSVRFRFYFGATFNPNNYEGCAIDEFIVKEEQAIDAGILSIDFPTGNCLLSNNEFVVISIQNFGYDTIASFDVAFSTDGLNFSTEAVSQIIPPGEVYEHVFSTGIPWNIPGPYTLDALIDVSGDTYTYNNQKSISFELEPGKSLPYAEDFENGAPDWFREQEPGATGWLFSSDYSSDGFSIPAHTTYAASNDDTCFCNSANDMLISPSFDLSNNTSFWVEFEAFFTGQYSSDANVLVSADCGYTWIEVFDIPSFAGGWIQYTLDLSSFSGEASVKLAFQHSDQGVWASGLAIDDVYFYGDQQLLEHEIPIHQGWGLYSTYLIPQDSALNLMLSGILPQVEIMKDGNGDIYWPAFNFNSIGSWKQGKAYQILATQNDTLIVVGSLINPVQLGITLPAGWSMIGYVRNSNMPIIDAMQSIVNELYLIKDEDGLVYWPLYSLDAIETIKTGKGYQILMNSPVTLVYPPN